MSKLHALKKVSLNSTWDMIERLEARNFEPLASALATVEAKGYRIAVQDTTRGKTKYRAKTVSVPLWAMRHKNPDYCLYYLAHELAHVIAYGHGHDLVFMQALMRICPPELVHYELEYKPTMAKAAGISILSSNEF